MSKVVDQVLTVAQMRAAEQALIERGETVDSLMLRAGRGAADWVWRVAVGRQMTVLCGPGNNGGDGYVIAETLRARGAAVSVVAPLEPTTEAARHARAAYRGPLVDHARGGVFVDCLFGSGLSRPLSERPVELLGKLARSHDYRIAVDLPSGIESDSAELLNEVLPSYHLTLALGAWKFAHWLLPAREAMGQLRLVDIGVEAVQGAARLIRRPRLSAPATDAHKYTRGLLAIVVGDMQGAAILAARAAMESGAGYVKLLGQAVDSPEGLVTDPRPLDIALSDGRINAVAIGSGLGRDDHALAKLDQVLAARHPALLDADALHLLTPEHTAGRAAPLILTPHAGEFAALAQAFGIAGGDRRAKSLELAAVTGAVVVGKGPDTIVAGPDGRLAIAPPASSWLSTAGTGDVLAGIIASRLASGEEPFAAACQGVWLHGEAARMAGAAMTAGELAEQVGHAYASCL